jgi:flagellar assembly protein FliH
LQTPSSAAGKGSAVAFETFEYPHTPGGKFAPNWNGYDDHDGEPEPESRSAGDRRDHMDWEKRLAEESRKAFDAGRERGRVEAREAERESLTNARREEERRMAGLVESFAAARDHYLRAVEGEVVKLALAVAARILRREAQMDPLLLTGAIRVALGQLSQTSEVRLRVPAGDLELWREAIAHLPNLPLKPEVQASEGMRLGDCIVECNLGSVDLGVRSQLGEIERGFFDRAGGESRKESTHQLPAPREASE